MNKNNENDDQEHDDDNDSTKSLADDESHSFDSSDENEDVCDEDDIESTDDMKPDEDIPDTPDPIVSVDQSNKPYERVMGVDQTKQSQTKDKKDIHNMDAALKDNHHDDKTHHSSSAHIANDQDIQKLKNELADLKDKYVRSVAELENIRKRNARERQDISKYAISSFAKDLLGFADNFHRALDSIPAELVEEDERIKSTIGGIEAMERDLLKIFDKHGIEKVDPIDEAFNPNFHEVMFETPGTGKSAGTIVQVLEPGYMLHDRLLKPARVGIAKDDGSVSDQPPQGGQNIDEEI